MMSLLMSALPRRTVVKGLIASIPASLLQGETKGKHLLYVANPGIRNYVEHGGVGITIFDIEDGYKFVRRIPTWDVPDGQKPENVKGVAASAKTGRIFVTTINRMMALDAVSGKKL